MIDDLIASTCKRLVDEQEKLLREFHAEHGRWPMFLWHTVRSEPGSRKITFTLHAGDEQPVSGVLQVLDADVLNRRGIKP